MTVAVVLYFFSFEAVAVAATIVIAVAENCDAMPIFQPLCYGPFYR